jgi:putative membrane protein
MKDDINHVKQRNYTPLITVLSIAIVGIIVLLYFMPKGDGTIAGINLTFLPLLNALFNSFTFVFLLTALIMIKQKNIKRHRRFIFAAFTTTALFFISYLTYHSAAPSTHYGGGGLLMYVYYFILITHIFLAAVIVPLALISVTRGLNMQVEKHRKIARWTMPIWLYVSFTGVLVYLMISPYY